MRGQPRPDLVVAPIQRLHAHDPTGFKILSGTAPPPAGVCRNRPNGVDETAIQAARRLGMPTVVYPVDWIRHGKQAVAQGTLRKVYGPDGEEVRAALR
jgi:hypothetical protein